MRLLDFIKANLKAGKSLIWVFRALFKTNRKRENINFYFLII